MKPDKYGIKAYKLCDSSNGYCARFELYTATPHGEPTGHGSTYDLVFRLVIPYLFTGRILFTDNYYSSLQLFMDLYDSGIGATGTTRNRKEIPDSIKYANVKKRGENVVVNNNPLVCAKVMDKKAVTFLSTAHSFKMVALESVDFRGNPIERLEMMNEYNKYMGGVDVNDQMLSYHTFN